MTFATTWHNLLENVEDVAEDATFLTPLSEKAFHITDVQEPRLLIQYRDDDATIPLQREQFETLFQRIQEANGSFDLDRLPPDAEPYATVVSLHPRYDLDQQACTITESETSTGSPLVEAQQSQDTDSERAEPDIDVYSDALLLIDALERYDITAIDEVDTAALVNLYTLLSDVQRNANDLRQDVRSVLLDRLHHDRPAVGSLAPSSGPLAGTARSKTTISC